jgi:acetylornithine deacetylase/succinyl-diaminopimelate desuccinylase
MLPGESAATVEPEIRAILAEALREDGIEAEILGFSSTAGPSETPPDDAIVRAAVSACATHGIDPPGPAGFLGGCDLVHFQDVGIRGVVVGPGSLAQAHQPNEWVLADDLVRASLIYRELGLRFFAGDEG